VADLSGVQAECDFRRETGNEKLTADG
jgi:hypothetical protein